MLKLESCIFVNEKFLYCRCACPYVAARSLIQELGDIRVTYEKREKEDRRMPRTSGGCMNLGPSLFREYDWLSPGIDM